MDQGHLLRRAVHMTAPLFLIYYFLPENILGLNKNMWLGVGGVAVFIFEAWRLRFNISVIGMRKYEQGRISAAAWFMLACLITLPFFPLGYTLPVFLGMGFVDPLIGELRLRSSKLYPWLPTLIYFLLAGGSLVYVFGLETHVIVAAVVATALAMWVEGLKTEILDDDFTMIVVPLVGIALTFRLLG